MRICISNFRCFKDETVYEFENGKLTLLKGPSGAGKSTIFEALRWCLYGNLRNIQPGSEVKGNVKTKVTLDYSNVIITRTYPPEQLTFQFPNQNNEMTTLVQQSAQDAIDATFGNRNVWNATSLIRQGEKCPLMTGSNTERMTLLNEILFGNDNSSIYENPEFYIEKIDSELEKVSKDLTGRTAVFNNEYNKYVSSFQNFENKYQWTTMTPELIDQYKNTIVSQSQMVDRFSNELIEVSSKEKLQQMLYQNISQMEPITSISENDIRIVMDFLNSKNNEIDSLKTVIQNTELKNNKYNLLKNEIDKYQLESNDLSNLSDETLNILELKNKINQLISLQNETKQKESKKLILTQKKNDLTNSILRYETQLKNYSIQDIEILASSIKNSKIYHQLQKIHSKMEKIDKSQIKNLTDLENFDTVKLNQDYQEALRLETLCTKYGIDRSNVKDIVTKSINDIKLQTEARPHRQRFQQTELIKNEIQKLELSLNNIKVSDTDYESLDSFKQKLRNLENQVMNTGTPLKCPHCQCTVELKNNQLVIPEILNPEEARQEIVKLRELIKNIETVQKIKNEIHNLNQKLSLIEPFDMELVSEKVIDTFELNKLNEISRIDITYCHLPSSFEINKEILSYNLSREYFQLKSEYETTLQQFNNSVKVFPENELPIYEKQLIELPMLQNELTRCKESLELLLNEINQIIIDISSEELQKQINELNDKIITIEKLEHIKSKIVSLQSELIQNSFTDTFSFEQKLKLLLSEKDILETDLQNKKSQFQTYTEYLKLRKQYSEIIITTSSDILKERIEVISETISELNDQHQRALLMYQIIQDQKTLESYRNSVIELTQKQTTLLNLKKLITDVMNSTLQDLVDNITNTTNTVLEELFDKSISIELKLYREIKSKNITKPQVNIIIYHNGNIYDNIGPLSGGERDRVSLAMTVALSIIHTSPIVLLDECMAALNPDLREDCIESMKKFLIEQGQKTVINVEHAGIDGLYDCVIEVN